MKKLLLPACIIVILFVRLHIFGQPKGNDAIYLFAKDWEAAKGYSDAAFFMQVIQQGDSVFSCRYYHKTGPMIKVETYSDAALIIPCGRFCWYD